MDLIGCYKNEKNENFDEFFRIMGVPYIVRTLFLRSRPTIVIQNADDYWKITVMTMLSSREKSFHVGHAYTEYLPGKVVRSITTIEHGNLVTRSNIDDELQIKTSYEIAGEKLTITLLHEATGVQAKRYFIQTDIAT